MLKPLHNRIYDILSNIYLSELRDQRRSCKNTQYMVIFSYIIFAKGEHYEVDR